MNGIKNRLDKTFLCNPCFVFLIVLAIGINISFLYFLIALLFPSFYINEILTLKAKKWGFKRIRIYSRMSLKTFFLIICLLIISGLSYWLQTQDYEKIGYIFSKAKDISAIIIIYIGIYLFYIKSKFSLMDTILMKDRLSYIGICRINELYDLVKNKTVIGMNDTFLYDKNKNQLFFKQHGLAVYCKRTYIDDMEIDSYLFLNQYPFGSKRLSELTVDDISLLKMYFY